LILPLAAVYVGACWDRVGLEISVSQSSSRRNRDHDELSIEGKKLMAKEEMQLTCS
jgi:hypothetical protein